MSKINDKWYSLPPLQKRIILSLAENGVQTRNEVHKNVKSGYKNILFSFASLEKKELIRVVGKKFWMGREFPQFWLTQKGTLVALANHAKVQTVEENALKLCKRKEDRETLTAWFDMVEALGPEKAFKFIEVVEGKLEIKAIPILSLEEAEEFVNSLQKHPKYRKEIKQGLSAFLKVLIEKENNR